MQWVATTKKGGYFQHGGLNSKIEGVKLKGGSVIILKSGGCSDF